MDVRCEKCKTEYEFDDARISEAGVTVKCTSCGHVFKVKKRALVVTVPVGPGETEGSLSGSSAPGDRPREWKVRQSNGNVFTFKELTTLQKWIVERKVVRDDEISLTGESWKRLGNIAELASFFQVVDDAQRAQAYAQQPLGGPGMPSPSGNFGLPSVPAPQPLGAATLPPSGSFTVPQPLGVLQSPPAGQFSAPPAVNVHVTTSPGPAAAPPPPRERSSRRRNLDPTPMEIADDRKRAGVSGGAVKWILILLLLGALGGGGYYGYLNYWLPEQQRLAALEKEKADGEAKAKADQEAQAKVKEDAAKAEEERLKKEKEAALLAAAKADAGPPDAGTAEAKKEVQHDFDWYMERGDHLREADRAEAALDAYGKAAEMKPDRSEPIAGKGLALLDMGSTLQAEASFKQALSLNPRYGVAIMGLAETYKAMGKKEEAVQYYQRYLDELPDGPEASVARNAIQKLK